MSTFKRPYPYRYIRSAKRRKRRGPYFKVPKSAIALMDRRMSVNPSKGIFRTSGHESKFVDFVRTDVSVATGGTFQVSIAVIPEGDGESERVGRKVTLTGVTMRYQASLAAESAAATVGSGDTVRIILMVDNQTNLALPSVLDLLETAAVRSHYNLNNVGRNGRFAILLDKFITINRVVSMNDSATTSASPLVLSPLISKTCKLNTPIEYNSVATTGAITTQTGKGLLLFYISQNGEATLANQVRVRYSDK